MNAVARSCLGGLLALSLAVPALAQESKSAALVKQLSAALDEASSRAWPSRTRHSLTCSSRRCTIPAACCW